MTRTADVTITIPEVPGEPYTPATFERMVRRALAYYLSADPQAIEVTVNVKCQCPHCTDGSHPEAWERTGTDEQYVTIGRVHPTAETGP